mgnify:CR=1 FL=1
MKFEDFQKKVIDVTNTVGKKTNDLIEEGKLLYKIRETEREIDRLYQDLGRAVYEADETDVERMNRAMASALEKQYGA